MLGQLHHSQSYHIPRVRIGIRVFGILAPMFLHHLGGLGCFDVIAEGIGKDVLFIGIVFDVRSNGICRIVILVGGFSWKCELD